MTATAHAAAVAAAVRQRLAEQLSYYLSDDNLATDEFMRRQMSCHGWQLPLLALAPFKLVDRYLKELGAWSCLTDRLSELQAAARACPELELCGAEETSVRRSTPIATVVLELAEAAESLAVSLASAEAEEAVAAGGPARQTFAAVLLPLIGRPRVLHLPRRVDYLHVLCEAVGGESLLPITLGSKGREATGPRVFARVDPVTLGTAHEEAGAAATGLSAASAPADMTSSVNALASELSGVEVRGAAVVANVHLRHAKLLCGAVDLADLALMVAEKRGVAGLLSKRLGWPCLGAWQLPRACAWPSTLSPKKCLVEYLSKLELADGTKAPGPQFATPGNNPPFTSQCNLAREAFPPGFVPRGATPLLDTHWNFGGGAGRGGGGGGPPPRGLPTKREAENEVALLAMQALLEARPPTRPLQVLGVRAAAPDTTANAAPDTTANAVAAATAALTVTDAAASASAAVAAAEEEDEETRVLPAGSQLVMSSRLWLATDPADTEAKYRCPAEGAREREGWALLEVKERATVQLGGGVLLASIEEELATMVPTGDAATGGADAATAGGADTGGALYERARLLHVEATHHGVPARCLLELVLHEASPPDEQSREEEVVVGEATTGVDAAAAAQRGGGGDVGGLGGVGGLGRGLSVGRQRMELVVGLVREWRPASLVDLGCGDGALLRRLVGDAVGPLCGVCGDGGGGQMQAAQAAPPRPFAPARLLGIDTSARALRTAANKLRRTLEGSPTATAAAAAAAVAAATSSSAAATDGVGMAADVAQTQAAATAAQRPPAPPPPPSVVLQHGSFEGLDAALRAEAVVAIEVVEHLDPAPLAAFGDALLGVCRPKHALVSTPNYEFNATWNRPPPKASGGKTGGGGGDKFLQPLRNADHRFEWTRAEFGDWARPLASRHGYEVAFVGVGGYAFDDAERPGPVTQVAIFERRADAADAESGGGAGGGGGGAWPECEAGVVRCI